MALDCSFLRDRFTYDPERGALYRIRFRGHPVRNAVAVDTETITIDGRQYKTDRVILCYVDGIWPIGKIEHLNGDVLDFRIDNLLERRDIVEARRSPRDGKLRGAHLNKNTGRWYAMISRNGKNHSLGTFATQEEAHEAYMQAKFGMLQAA